MGILFNILLTVGILICLGFLLHTYLHIKYLNQREIYWDDVKAKREEKERLR